MGNIILRTNSETENRLLIPQFLWEVCYCPSNVGITQLAGIKGDGERGEALGHPGVGQ
jgi:hypothetical protein